MSETAPLPPAGWHPDPSGTPNLRWWDGQQWTAHTAPAPPPHPAADGPGLLEQLADAFDGVDEDLGRLAWEHQGRLQALGPKEPRGIGVPPALGLVLGFVLGGLAAMLWFDSADFRVPGIVGLVAVVTVPSGWRGLWARWGILDTPTVDAAGARPGRCELAGRVEPATGTTLLAAPLSGQPTIAWSQAVDRWEKRGKSHRWVERWRDERVGALTGGFLLRCPSGGAVTVRVDEPKRVLRPIASSLEVRTGGLFGRRHRLRENGLVPGDPLFCLGEVSMTPTGTLVLDDPSVVVHGGEAAALRAQSRLVFLGVTASTALVAMLSAMAAGGPEQVGDTRELTRPAAAAAAAVGAVAVLAGIGLTIRWWNRLVALVEQVRAAWGHLEVDVQRRHDTIGALVDVVRAAAAHERAVQQLSVTARTGLGGYLRRGVPDADRVTSADVAITGEAVTERQVLALAEGYPELRAGDQYRKLYGVLVGIENRIAAARRFYNDAITLLDTRVDTFPGVLVRSRILPSPRPALLAFTDRDLPTMPTAAT